MEAQRIETEVDGRHLVLSRLDRVLYPQSGFTKGQVLDYYVQIARVMLPHLRGRPVTFRRYPLGVGSRSFLEQHAPARRPSWVSTTTVPSSDPTRGSVEFVVVPDRPTLLWAANLAAIEFHVPVRHAYGVDAPSRSPHHVVYELDPGPGAAVVDCCRVAQWIADDVGRRHLLATTSGAKGLHLYRLRSDASFERARKEAHELARELERRHPGTVVSTTSRARRAGKVLIDWSQNTPSKTTVAPCSLRAGPLPTVSTPVTWAEVDACATSGESDRLRFGPHEVIQRVAQDGDLLAAFGAAAMT